VPPCPTAQRQNSKGASQNFEGKKYEDTRIKPRSPITGRDHEHIVSGCMQEVLIKIGTQGSEKENYRDQTNKLVADLVIVW
jgi:hypothetical protein